MNRRNKTKKMDTANKNYACLTMNTSIKMNAVLYKWKKKCAYNRFNNMINAAIYKFKQKCAWKNKWNVNKPFSKNKLQT
jgi:hypothetical protein